jgi:hypothetical protein
MSASGQPGRRPKMPEGSYATVLEQMLASGDRQIDVYVWHESQKLPAGRYVETNSKNYPDADIQIVVSSEPVKTGDVVNGRKVIRYHFT